MKGACERILRVTCRPFEDQLYTEYTGDKLGLAVLGAWMPLGSSN